MRRLVIPVFRTLALLAVALPLVAAAAELKVRKPTPAEVGQQATCPVMSTQFTVGKDTPTVDYKGRAYHFCCEPCLREFRKTPEKFASAAPGLDVRKPAADELGKKVRCAVTGTELTIQAETRVIDYRGKPYYFCCDHCVADFRAKPDRYAAR